MSAAFTDLTLAGTLLACLLAPASVLAQNAPLVSREEATAVRVPSGAIRLDGRLDEETWHQAPALTEFVQKEPVEGAPATDPMEIRFAYDDGALYVGARMFSRSREAIQAPLGRRDNTHQSEYVLVSLDTYLDRRTAYTFGVTASGIRLDHFHPADDEARTDPQFDPVWEARAAITDDGWTAELWIPFSQLRFNALAEQVWGLNVHRWIPSRNEDVYWVLIPRTVQGWASRFGTLRGLRGVEPTRRVEILPYVGGTSVISSERDPANPFDEGGNLGRRIGGDLKMGLGPNLTLEATVNPDFGQVEADPAEVNLSAFETFFEERRPFFVEGSQVLHSRVAPPGVYFYSRRIGAAPTAPASGDYVEYPRESTILGAAKLTGRLASGTSIGLLAAMTAKESARTYDLGSPAIKQTRVAPRTTVAVGRIEQEFGRYQSTASAMVTALHRDVSAGDPLAARVARNAVTANGDSLLRFRGGEYEVRLHGGTTYVNGESEAILGLQRSNMRYFQRPDTDYVMLDAARRRLVGFKGGAIVERTSGVHWLWLTSVDAESPEFEVNDLGRLRNADAVLVSTNLRYRETQPGPLLRSYTIGVRSTSEWNFGWDQQIDDFQTNTSLTWSNFWSTDLSVLLHRRAQDERLTRGGPSMETPRGWRLNGQLRNSSSSTTGWNGRFAYGRNEDGGLFFSTGAGISVRPASRWQLSFDPTYDRQLDTQQYVTTLARTGQVTYGYRYIFAFIDRSTLSARVRLNFTVKPDLTLDVYAEPFAASGDYYRYGELRAARRRFRAYGTGDESIDDLGDGSLTVTSDGDRFTLGNRDFNTLSFRSNVVLRWEWRPGSTLYAVWQQNRSSSVITDARIDGRDLFDSLSAPGQTYFVVKASFWIHVD